MSSEKSPGNNRQGPQEACGITAILSKDGSPVSQYIGPMQGMLKRRGHDAAGIASLDGGSGKINIYKSLGSVAEVFPPDFDYAAHGVLSDMAIGHNRYTTDEKDNEKSLQDAQPLLVEGNGSVLAVAYNGNLPQDQRDILISRLPDELKSEKLDTRIIANAIVHAEGESLEEKVKNGMEGVDRSYNLTLMNEDGEIGAVRGTSGTMSLWVGESAKYTIVASETIVDTVEDIDDMTWRLMRPGEFVKATKEGATSVQLYDASDKIERCSLQDIYTLAREGWLVPGLKVKDFRYEVGRTLARKGLKEVDIVASVPKGGDDIAKGFADELGVELTEVLVAHDGNTFIGNSEQAILEMIGKKQRLPNPQLVKGRSVRLIEDSVIRGNTSGGDRQERKNDNGSWKERVKGFVELVRDAGATEVHVTAALPKFVNGCDLGYYIKEGQLVALMKNAEGEYDVLSDQEVAEAIGADSLTYLGIDELESLYDNLVGEKPCTRCFFRNRPVDIFSRSETDKEAVAAYAAD